MRKILNRKAFTLIELLVVIAIIGILAAVVMVSLNTARGKARDAQRQSDIVNIATALEMYYDNQTVPSYPISGTAALTTAIVTNGEYMAKLPTDPDGTNYTYVGCNAVVPKLTTGAIGACGACGTACAAPPCTNFCVSAVLDSDVKGFSKP